MKSCAKITAQKKRVDDYEWTVETIQEFRFLKSNWAKLIKRGKLQEVDAWRMMMWRTRKDEPVDMAEIWNWMVKHDRKEAQAYHAAVGTMLDDAIAENAARVRALCA